jgi:hypothetical protein
LKTPSIVSTCHNNMASTLAAAQLPRQASPEYMSRLPCAQHAFDDVVDVIRQAQRALHAVGRSPREHVELELRFGQVGDQRQFVPGVAPRMMQALEQRLDSGRDWARVVPWYNVQSYFHASGVPGDTRKLRTEAAASCSSDGGPAPFRLESLHKRSICRSDYRCVALREVALQVPDRPLIDLRIAVNIEQHVAAEELPERIEPDGVHFKERKEYHYAPTGEGSPVWVYVLTRRWHGDTLENALLSRQREPPTCEVELECLRPDYFAEDKGTTTESNSVQQRAEHVAAQLLYKAHDLMAVLSPLQRDPGAFMMEPVNKNLLWARRHG